MITLSRCFCGGVAHISAEESRYNNQYTPWDARCECSKCSFAVPPSLEHKTKKEAVAAVADRWNDHSAIKTVARLQQQNAELVAQVSRMQTFIRMSADKWKNTPELEPTFLNLLRVANQQPEEALRDIQAEAAEKYYYMGWEHSLSTKADDGDHYSCGKRLAKEFAERVKAGEV